MWAEITASVNEIGESQREVIEIIKKWSDLKCDTKRKVAAMRSGANFKGINSRLSRDLSPTENIVHQILELDGKRSRVPGLHYGAFKEGDDDEGPEEEDEEEDMAGIHSYPNEGIDVSMPPPSTLSSAMPMSFSMGMPMPGPGHTPIPPVQPKDDHSMPTYSGSSSELSTLKLEGSGLFNLYTTHTFYGEGLSRVHIHILDFLLQEIRHIPLMKCSMRYPLLKVRVYMHAVWCVNPTFNSVYLSIGSDLSGIAVLEIRL